MYRQENTFYEAGGSSFAPLSTYEWWVLWQALQHTSDKAKVTAALKSLGSLVQTDWLDSLPPVPDDARPVDVLKAMFAAHDQHEDEWIDHRCTGLISSLSRLRCARAAYRYDELDGIATTLVEVAGEFIRIARERREETERGDREAQ